MKNGIKTALMCMCMLLWGCTGGSTVFPEIDAAELKEDVETEFLTFSVQSVSLNEDGTLEAGIDVENTFSRSVTVFDTDFWVCTGEADVYIYPDEEVTMELESGDSGTMTLVWSVPAQEEYLIGYMDVRSDGSFGETYYVRFRVR